MGLFAPRGEGDVTAASKATEKISHGFSRMHTDEEARRVKMLLKWPDSTRFYLCTSVFICG